MTGKLSASKSKSTRAIKSTRDIRIKTKEILISQIKKSLDICDIFQAAKTYSDLFHELGQMKKKKF